jgi:hypothetical protein
MSAFLRDFLNKYKDVDDKEDEFYTRFMHDTELMLGINSSKLSELTGLPSSMINRWKEGYLPQSFQILGFDDSKVKQSSDYEYIVDVKLGSIPLKVESK